jgi:hypothetical protein
MRLNLSKQKSETLLITEPQNSVDNKIWKFGVKKGVYWWNNDPFSLQDLKQFLDANLDRVLKQKTGSLWAVPTFSIKIANNFIEIHWKTSPPVGPYILNGVSLWRSSKNPLPREVTFECAGNFKITSLTQEALEATGVEAYGKSAYHLRLELSSQHTGLDLRHKGVFFRTSSDTVTTPSQLKNTTPSCPVRVPLPFFTVIKWNLHSQSVSTSEERKRLTSLIPRGFILRTLSGGLAELVSAPIPRFHPGYNQDLYVYPFLSSSKMALNADFLKLKTRKILFKTASDDAHRGVVTKIIFDHFKISGLNIEVLSPNKDTNFDGYVTGLSVDLPELNFITDFHSKLSSSAASMRVRLPDTSS